MTAQTSGAEHRCPASSDHPQSDSANVLPAGDRLLRDLALAKAEFQLRAIKAALNIGGRQ